MKLYSVSDPAEVVKRGRFLLNTLILPSTRDDKKYMVIRDKWSPSMDYIHFGDMNDVDYLKHKDENKKMEYRSKYEGGKILSPEWLEYHMLYDSENELNFLFAELNW